MNIRDLEYLVALAEHRHFRRAADSCHVSQPTLSGQIRKLEDELGVMLLERTSRKVLFTQAGLLLVDQARTVLREVKVLKEMASQQGEAIFDSSVFAYARAGGNHTRTRSGVRSDRATLGLAGA